MASGATATPKVLMVRKQVFDIDEFDNMTLVQEVPAPSITSLQDALAAVGNDESKLIELLKIGFEDKLREETRAKSEGWHTFKKNADGEDTIEINGPYTGTAADDSRVTALVLSMAKNMYANLYATDRKAAKDKARELIKNTPAIRQDLVSK